MHRNSPIHKINLLFICSRNQWHSPTAEKLWRRHLFINSQSAGTRRSAHRKVSTSDINWADIIMVMATKHKNRLQAEFNRFTALQNNLYA